MAFDTILTSQEGASFVITLNRPDRRNAFSIQMMKEIAQACQAAEQDPSIRAVIVTGGTKGIGRVIATTFLEAGADGLNDRADGVRARPSVPPERGVRPAQLEPVLDELDALGGPRVAGRQVGRLCRDPAEEEDDEQAGAAGGQGRGAGGGGPGVPSAEPAHGRGAAR